MKIGTKSILFGVHQFAIHPWFVAWAWWRLYGFPWDPRLWIAFFLHDLGYWGKPNMNGPEGETHPNWAADVMGELFGAEWSVLCRYHSRFLAKKYRHDYSRLCVADKLALALTPAWLYLPLAKLSGELQEYMEGTAGERTPGQWYRDIQRYCKAWAAEHSDGRPDEWTGTVGDLDVPSRD